MRHVLMECPTYKHIRDKLMRDVHQCWSSANKLQTWREHNWLTCDLENWDTLWSFQGHCPNITNLDSASSRCMKQTGLLCLHAAWEMWEHRNKCVLEVEEKNGVKEKKAVMGRQQWKIVFHGPHNKRGRPKLSDENLNSEVYKERRRLKETKERFIREMGKESGTREYNFWRRNEITKARRARAKCALKQPSLPTEKLSSRRPVKSKRKLLRKSLRKEVNKILPEGKCGVKGCTRQPTTTAMHTVNSTSASHRSGVRLRALHGCAGVERHASADEDRVVQSSIVW